MPESSLGHVEDLYRERIRLLEELLECVQEERACLINVNVESLWSLMERKQVIIKGIEGAGQGIREAMEMDRPGEDSPGERRAALAALSRRTKALQGEIKARVSENTAFVQDTLKTFNDLISTLISAGEPDSDYRPAGRTHKGLPNLLYHKEV